MRAVRAVSVVSAVSAATPTRRAFGAALLALAACGLLAACGKKGSLELPPPEAEDDAGEAG